MNKDTVFICSDSTGVAAVRCDRRGQPLLSIADSFAWRSMHAHAATVDKQSAFKAQVFDAFDACAIITARGKGGPAARLFPQASPVLTIEQLAWPLVHADIMHSPSLESLCHHLEIANPAPGTLAGECESLARAYWTLMSRYTLALKGEELCREAGGKPLAVIRRVFGV